MHSPLKKVRCDGSFNVSGRAIRLKRVDWQGVHSYLLLARRLAGLFEWEKRSGMTIDDMPCISCGKEIERYMPGNFHR